MSDESKQPPWLIPQDVNGVTRFLMQSPDNPAVYHDGSRVLQVVLSRMFWKTMPDHNVPIEDRKEMMEGWLTACNSEMQKLGLAEIGWDEATADIEIPPRAVEPSA